MFIQYEVLFTLPSMTGKGKDGKDGKGKSGKRRKGGKSGKGSRDAGMARSRLNMPREFSSEAGACVLEVGSSCWESLRLFQWPFDCLIFQEKRINPIGSMGLVCLPTFV